MVDAPASWPTTTAGPRCAWATKDAMPIRARSRAAASRRWLRSRWNQGLGQRRCGRRLTHGNAVDGLTSGPVRPVENHDRQRQRQLAPDLEQLTSVTAGAVYGDAAGVGVESCGVPGEERAEDGSGSG